MKEWKQAFKLSLPIFFGYLFLGIAFAILMVQDGYSGWWAIFSSILCMQAQCNLPLSAL